MSVCPNSAYFRFKTTDVNAFPDLNQSSGFFGLPMPALQTPTLANDDRHRYNICICIGEAGRMHAVQFSRVISTDALSLVEPILNPQRISFVIEQWRCHAHAADQSVFWCGHLHVFQ
jgi:hypothetical protein